MLRLVLEYQNVVKDIKYILGFIILKVKRDFMGLLKRKIYGQKILKKNINASF